MALPGSGNPISLNEMHIEAGGSSGTLATINDSDIRGLISKSSGVQMSFNEWYDASAVSVTWSGSQANISDMGGSGTTARARVTFKRDGTITVLGNQTNDLSGVDWLDAIGSSNGDDFQVIYTLDGANSTQTPSGNISTSYQDMNIDRFLEVTRSTLGTDDARVGISFRKKGTTSPVYSRDVDLSVLYL